LPLRFEGKQLSKPILQQISNYLILYASLFTALTLVVAVDLNDFESAFSAVAATFNNIGPGLGLVGPAHNYSFFSAVFKSYALVRHDHGASRDLANDRLVLTEYVAKSVEYDSKD